MLNVTEFLPWVLPKAPGCSTPLATQAIVDAAIAFCEDSMVIREWVTPIPTVAGTDTYTLSGDADQQVSRVMSVKVNGTTIAPMPSSMEGNLETQTNQKPTRYYTRTNGANVDLVLVPKPDAVYSVDVQVAMRPRRGVTQVADDLFHRWVEPVSAGALYRILGTPGQPFSDPSSAVYMGQMAVAGARKARIASDTGQVRTTSSVAMRPWGR